MKIIENIHNKVVAHFILKENKMIRSIIIMPTCRGWEAIKDRSSYQLSHLYLLGFYHLSRHCKDETSNKN
jgi:hypothetical protein